MAVETYYWYGYAGITTDQRRNCDLISTESLLQVVNSFNVHEYHITNNKELCNADEVRELSY